ncbi:hypothetical protein JXO59_15295 [candidate division KSB1 bacterium]|nr:hypothetical protein [candidate division KSB1 bacterium]
MKNFYLQVIFIAFWITGSLAFGGPGYNVKEFGAGGGGIVYDTAAVQAAIDSAYNRGGGTVCFPAGTYLIKTIVLKNDVGLHLDHGAVLLGSAELNQFDPQFGSFIDSGGRRFGTCLIFAREAQNISITGHGVIDGQGYEKYYPKEKGLARPSIIRFICCRNVRIEDVRLINSAAWVQHYIDCDDLLIRGITVNSYANKNNDGLDIEGCQRVVITQCNISSEDDAVVLKTLSRRPCKDVVISDCIVSGLKSAIKIGTESAGDFENIAISNCVFYGTRGISLLSVDGGTIRNITISNISMRDSYAVIVMRLGSRMRPYALSEEERPQAPGAFRQIMIHNIQATSVTESNDFISGIPNAPIEDVILSNIRITYKGGGKKSDSEREIEELTDEYPKAKMFGVLPSYGFYIRHAKNIRISDVELSYDEPDLRSAVVCEDVADLQMMGMRIQSGENSAPLIRLNACRNVRICDCRPTAPVDVYLEVRGGMSQDIEVAGYAPRWAKKSLALGKGVSGKEIVLRKTD